MRCYALFSGLTLMSLSVTGCGQMSWSPNTAQRGGIAVVDLDKVAAETGRNRQLAQAIEMAGSSLNQQLAKTMESAKDQREAKVRSFGEQMTEDEQKELNSWTILANNKLAQLKNEAQKRYELFRQDQVAQFRGEVKPIAQEIAAKRGLSVVVPKNEGLLLSVDPGIDITDEVVKVMREKHPAPTKTAEVPPAPVQAAQPAKPVETPSTPAESDEAPKRTATKRTSSAGKPSGSQRSTRSADDQ